MCRCAVGVRVSSSERETGGLSSNVGQICYIHVLTNTLQIPFSPSSYGLNSMESWTQ